MTPLSWLTLLPVGAFFSLGPTEMVILLVIMLILLGGSRLPDSMRGMSDGIQNFKDGMRQDEVWQFNEGRQRQLNESPGAAQNRNWLVWFIVGGALLSVIAVGVEEEISTKQMFFVFGVLLGCALAWWFCFNKEQE